MTTIVPLVMTMLTSGAASFSKEHSGKISGFAKTVTTMLSGLADPSGEDMFPSMLTPNRQGLWRKSRKYPQPKTTASNNTRPNEVTMRRRNIKSQEVQEFDQNEAHFFAFEEMKTRRDFCQGGISPDDVVVSF
eukprot:TRINITY_DN11060_c0_g1_i3.p1 TRINITY_DN11060_c0_g1~~TRINITY_DN11060_c0_g1_i3.p1  ORF type:complete len:133 (+),score=14.55 TRINITY_DN11060_c0_g1_i3:58-456(+)